MNTALPTAELGWLLFGAILLGGLQAVACGVWAQTLATGKGHPGLKWFWIGFLFSAAGVIRASHLPELLPAGRRCESGFPCSPLCALINGCAGEEPNERGPRERLELHR